MTKWLYCPECKVELDNSGEFPACPNGHFVKYSTPVASAFIFLRKDDKYLFLKRNIEPRKGSWTVPGGFSDCEESIEETVVRELKEETSIKISVDDVTYMSSFFQDYGDKYGTTNIGMAFHAEIKEADIILDDENSEFGWFSLQESPRVDDSDVAQALEYLKNNLDKVV